MHEHAPERAPLHSVAALYRGQHVVAHHIHAERAALLLCPWQLEALHGSAIALLLVAHLHGHCPAVGSDFEDISAEAVG